MQFKILDFYTGKSHRVTLPDDPKYRTAILRYLPFDRCFSFTDDDVNDHKLYLRKICFCICIKISSESDS